MCLWFHVDNCCHTIILCTNHAITFIIIFFIITGISVTKCSCTGDIGSHLTKETPFGLVKLINAQASDVAFVNTESYKYLF